MPKIFLLSIEFSFSDHFLAFVAQTPFLIGYFLIKKAKISHFLELVAQGLGLGCIASDCQLLLEPSQFFPTRVLACDSDTVRNDIDRDHVGVAD